MITAKKSIFVLIFLLVFVASFSNLPCQAKSVNDTALQTLELSSGFISPKGGASIESAQKLIVTHLKTQNIQGPIDAQISIEEITTAELWANVNLQLFRLKLDYAWMDGVAIFKDSELVGILSSMKVDKIFLADLDNDLNYEIYLNVSQGSGIVSKDIIGFNTSSEQKVSLSRRMKQDYRLFIEGNNLLVEQIPWIKSNDNVITTIGKLIIGDNKQLKIQIE